MITCDLFSLLDLGLELAIQVTKQLEPRESFFFFYLILKLFV